MFNLSSDHVQHRVRQTCAPTDSTQHLHGCGDLNPLGSCPEERVLSHIRPSLRLSAPAQMDEPKAGLRTHSLVHLPSLCVLCMSCRTAIRNQPTSKYHNRDSPVKKRAQSGLHADQTLKSLPYLSSPLLSSRLLSSPLRRSLLNCT